MLVHRAQLNCLHSGSMMNGLQTLPQWRGYFGHPNRALLGAMNAVYPVGKVCGLLPVTWISDHYGRKAPILAGFILLLIGTVIQTASQNLAMFIVSRFWIGVSTVFLSQPCPILVTELAYPTHRAKVTALYNTFYASTIFNIGSVKNANRFIVCRCNYSCLVDLWNVSTRFFMELEDPVGTSRSLALDSSQLFLARPRIS